MSLFVDDAKLPGTKGTHTSAWSHLFAAPGSDPESLHEMAGKLGIPRTAFNADRHPHYKVTEAKRREAIREGAHAVSVADAARIILTNQPAPKFKGAYTPMAKPERDCQVPDCGSHEARRYPAGDLCDPHMPEPRPQAERPASQPLREIENQSGAESGPAPEQENPGTSPEPEQEPELS